MNRRFSTLLGLALIGLGVLSMFSTVTMPILGFRFWHWSAWRLWPLLIVALGAVFMFVALTGRKRGLGAFFIPGVPILATGGILLFTSFFDVWGAWVWLWPLEVLAVATGFLFAALKMGVIWLLFPAIIIGMNGMLFQFCAITGWWEVWAVLWTVEPLSVGLALLAVYLRERSKGLLIAGMILCAIAAFGLVGMLSILTPIAFFPAWLFFNALGPLTLVGLGILLLITGLGHARSPHSDLPAAERATMER